MDPTQPHGRQLKRRPGGQTNADLGLKRKAKMDDSPVVEIRI
jgi:hypothetical protein